MLVVMSRSNDLRLRPATLRGPLLTALLLGACAGPAVPGDAAGAAARRAPNVVLVYVDDLGAGELGCYGQELIKTPHIDSIAAAGVRFNGRLQRLPPCARPHGASP